MTETSHVALQCITAPDVPPPAGHYSHAVKTGNWVFVSGVLPVTVTPEADFASQTEAALRQCQQILAAARYGWPQVAQCTAYIVGITHWPVFNQCYAHYLQHHTPVRAVVPVPALHHGYLIEHPTDGGSYFAPVAPAGETPQGELSPQLKWIKCSYDCV